jgi:hypothetical protein
MPVAGQAPSTAKTNGVAAKAYTPPRTPDGQPDLSGYWTSATYTPLEDFGPETYRRSVYHQNARASLIDVLTDFDAPDCAFSVSRRNSTTTPSQALAMMNHNFTINMANSFARRLSEAGVPFTLVNYTLTQHHGQDWDTHVNNFSILKNKSLPALDRALAALVSDLHERSLDRHVLVLVTGEFGRTPQINAQAGRDHWPGAFSVVFAGGGLRVGQVVGATDSRAMRPITRAYSPGDVLATVYNFLDIDTRREFVDRSGRPVRILTDGQPIPELVT